MTAVVGSGSAVDPGSGHTLEEQLRRAHDQLCLVADLFELQTVAPDAGWPDGLSPEACAALSRLYRQGSQELGATLDALPATVLNHSLAHPRDRISGEGDVGSPEHSAPLNRLADPEGADR